MKIWLLFLLYLVFFGKFGLKGGEQSPVLGQGGACNSVPNGPNDLKFCMQGAFVCYYWVLVHSSSCNLYNGQACSGLQMWLASIEVTWTWLDLWGLSYRHPLVQEPGLCSPPLGIGKILSNDIALLKTFQGWKLGIPTLWLLREELYWRYNQTGYPHW